MRAVLPSNTPRRCFCIPRGLIFTSPRSGRFWREIIFHVGILFRLKLFLHVGALRDNGYGRFTPAMSHVSETLRDDEYIGYTLHYLSQGDFHKVATHLTEKASAGGKFRYNIFLRADENFLFVRAHEKTTKIAVQCILRKDYVGNTPPRYVFTRKRVRS